MEIDMKLMVVHKLNIAKERPILSEDCVDLSKVENIEIALNFFKNHIEKVSNLSNTKRCQFMDIENNVVRKEISGIVDLIEDDLRKQFIEVSKNLTTRLAHFMRTTASKSDGSLIFIYYTFHNKNNIGILKMDPNDGIEIQEDLSIVVRKDMLPSPKEKLHKSAFIEVQNNYKENSFHLFVLDRQQNIKEPAQFFMDSFLNVKELTNDKIMTLKIQSEVYDLSNELIPPEKAPFFQAAWKRKLNECDTFNIDEDLPPLIRSFLSEEKKDVDLTQSIESIKRNLQRSIPGAVYSFKPDKEKIKPTLYQSIGNKIEVKIDPSANKEDYEISVEDGKFTLTIVQGLEMKLRK
ncbi:nucleoid-associated protein [Listeria ivanovii subsp. londoniensis]|uniref:nucleoid-associated protein n=1 Tax=Listeria ivanovii TaxID=1638 RepID=UPI001904B1E4|nr:nucleoid-associated protein [Listeria ivanovii]MBK1994971.1 nucleoid-associated protein [Listeria ivanovii subsp. londoniensis]